MGIVNKYGRTAHDADVKELFGFDRKAKWPVEGIAQRTIQGYSCWVRPLASLNVTGRGRVGGFALRAVCACHCGLVLPIGRLTQHQLTSAVHAEDRMLTRNR